MAQDALITKITLSTQALHLLLLFLPGAVPVAFYQENINVGVNY
jgi:hypothetical protein